MLDPKRRELLKKLRQERLKSAAMTTFNELGQDTQVVTLSDTQKLRRDKLLGESGDKPKIRGDE